MKTQKTKSSFSVLLVYAFLIVLMFVSLIPFVILIVNSTRLHAQIIKGFSLVPGPYFLRNLKNLLSNENIPILRALLNSVLVSSGTAFLATYFSAMTAYGIHLYRFPGRRTSFKIIMAVMMVPTQVTALGFVQLMEKMHLIDTLIPLIVPAIASPVVFFYLFQYMESSLPHSIVEASRVDGCNEFLTFNVVVLPMITPAIAVQAIFSFVTSWNNYFLPALIISSKNNKTIPILIAQLRNADYMKFDMAQVYMLVCIAIVPLLIAYLFLSHAIISGVTLGGVKE
jgi:ABC-type glycerol-3-phosphate transport system permease component